MRRIYEIKRKNNSILNAILIPVYSFDIVDFKTDILLEEKELINLFMN